MPRHRLVGAYLDHASVSPLRSEVIAALHEVLGIAQADPGRPYSEALVVRSLIEDARDEVAALASVTARQVVFTSSIAESINTAIAALTHGGDVLAAGTERSSVADAATRAGSLHELRVDRAGHLDLEHLAASLRQHPGALVCCQVANHETGVVTDVESVVALARSHGARVHVDASMALGHLEINLGALDADAVTIASELLGGPVGAAGLLVRKGRVLPPLLVGGAQERARRAGLENLLGIVGFGVAAAVLRSPDVRQREADAARAQIAELEQIVLAVDGTTAVGDDGVDRRAPHLRCFTIEGIEAEPVLLGLDRRGISIHSGSACSSESLEPSPVLRAMGLEADRSLRLSVGHTTTLDDVDVFRHAFAPVVSHLRSLAT